MSTAVAPRIGVCSEYQRLLHSCQIALSAWQQRQSVVGKDPIAAPKLRPQLKRLQDQYARASAQLESHEQFCQTCQYIAKVGGLDFESMASALGNDPFSK
jgi:hypothetical protein